MWKGNAKLTEGGIMRNYAKIYEGIKGSFSNSYNSLFYFFKLCPTSSGKLRVNSYAMAMVLPDWCLFGRHFIRSCSVTTPFFVGGGLRIRSGAFGVKTYTSICEKLTAACWHEQVKMMAVTKSHNCWRLVKDVGTPWSVCPAVTR